MEAFAYSLLQGLQNKNALKKGDKVLVSLSGGPDSMALYHFLTLAEKPQELTLKVIHFNHQVRSESALEEEFVKHEVAKRGHELICIDPSQTLTGTCFEGNFQAAARNWRRQVLFEELETSGFDKIATGHHGDDLTETMLFRLLRGCSLFGLEPFSMFDTPIIRPLICKSKTEILSWLSLEKIDFVSDSSNLEGKYKRNEIRQKAVPLLEQLAGGKLNARLGNIASELEELKELFDSQVSIDQYQRDELTFGMLQSLPSMFAKEVIMRFLNHHQVYEIHSSQVSEILALALSGKGGWRIDVKLAQVFGNKKIITLIKK
ncbi:MAG: tRNA lysidine(34) synthetase TilS [SAR324 cluster bacterium]|nr:tRNA lysidine(34) synthetase TilS [SAR324 cluster bacterium]